ncbi:MAG: hypothetical protein JST68_26785 [Bacteroidetes bacterium]|nr:hypothetical protein [Bacteroidota bacterium]
MSDITLHIRIKKDYAAALIEDLIKVNAVEAVDEGDLVDLTPQQKEALDKELSAISSKPNYLQNWDAVRQQLKKP